MSEQARAKDENKMQGTHADAPQQPKSSKTADNKKSGNIVTSTLVFLQEVVKEAKKITWPPRSQVIQETTSVIVLVTLITVMVLGFDYALGNWVFGPIEHLAKIMAPKTADDNGMFTPVTPQGTTPGPRTRDEEVPPQGQPQQQTPAPGATPTGSSPAPGATPGTPVTPSTTPVQTPTPSAPVGTVPAPTSAPGATPAAPATTTPAPSAPVTIPTPTAPPATPGASVPGATTPAKPAPATPTTPHP